VGGSERIVHVDIAQRGQRLGERGVVLLLAGVEPEVLQQDDLTGL